MGLPAFGNWRALRRGFGVALVAFVLGAVTNAMVAWGVMIWPALGTQQFDWDGLTQVQQATAVYEVRSVNVVLSARGESATWTIEGHEQPGKPGEHARDRASRRGGPGTVEGFAIELAKGAIPAWVARFVASDRHIFASEMYIGWPATVLRARAVAELIPGQGYGYTMLYQDWPDVSRFGWLPQWMHDARLPIVPVWPGFFINLCMYVSAWLSLFWLAGATRRVWRRVRYRRRGLCERCGYDLKGLEHAYGMAPVSGGVCPECGEPWQAAPRA